MALVSVDFPDSPVTVRQSIILERHGYSIEDIKTREEACRLTGRCIAMYYGYGGGQGDEDYPLDPVAVRGDQ